MLCCAGVAKVWCFGKSKGAKAIAVLRDSYSDCTVAPGDSCATPFLSVPPSVAWPASSALPHSRAVAVGPVAEPVVASVGVVAAIVPAEAGSDRVGIAGLRSNPGARWPSWTSCRRNR